MNRARFVDQLFRAASHLPLRALHAIGGGAGRLANRFPNEARHNARVNVELCFPERPLGERRALAAAAMRETARGMTELAALWYRPVDEVLARIRSVDGEAAFQEALGEGRGLLIIAPHLGAWEALQAWVGQHATTHALYRPPRQAAFEELITRARSRTGVTFWPATGRGVRALFKALRDGQAVGILPDQQPPEEGVFVPFFGVPAKTMTLFSKLAAKSGAPIVIGWAERLPRGEGYVLRWRRVQEPVGDPDPERGAAAMNRAIEAAVRECPAQYQWTYRRFSRQPEGVRNPYKQWVRRDGWVRKA